MSDVEALTGNSFAPSQYEHFQNRRVALLHQRSALNGDGRMYSVDAREAASVVRVDILQAPPGFSPRRHGISIVLGGTC